MHRGERLPDNVSCGARCERFPSCLPPLPAETVGLILELRAVAAAEQETTAALRTTLGRLHDAIEQGLALGDGNPHSGESDQRDA
jgi:hypothetical protein